MTKVDRHIWVEDRGAFVSENMCRLAEVINEYNPGLFLAPIPDQLRGDAPEYAYGLIYEADGHQEFVFKFKESEMGNPQEILTRILNADTKRRDVLTGLENAERAQRMLREKEQHDIDEANKEFALSILRSPLHTYRHNGRKYH